MGLQAPPRRRLMLALLHGLVLIPVARPSAATAQASPKEPPNMEHLTVRIGMHLDEVQRLTAIDLALASRQDDSPIILEHPLSLRYAMPRQVIALPPALTVWITQIAGVVVDLTLAPQLEALPLRPSRELAAALAQQLGAAGWQPVNAEAAPLPSEQALSAAVRSRPDRQLYQRTLGEWQSGSTRLTMSLKELSGDDSARLTSLVEVRFLVNLYFSDMALYTAQRKRLLERRARAGLADDERMPLSVWLTPR